jgi:copper(I)-binding protein
MNLPVRRRSIVHAGLALCASFAVPSVRAHACEFATAYLRITHPWTRATVAGDTSAKLCMAFEDVTLADRLISATSPVAGAAVIGRPVGGAMPGIVIPEGVETVLDEAGDHVLLVDLKHPLALGMTYPLTLVFEKGGTVEAGFDVSHNRIG